jgi:hypothetical protein
MSLLIVLKIMNKLRTLANGTVLTGILLLAGCNKIKYQADVHDYYPKLGGTTAKVESDGSVTATGTLQSAGSGELYFAGFCMDTVSGPELHIGQLLSEEISGSAFSASYSGLDGSKKYYIRSFAANAYGYAYGEEIVVDRPGPDTNKISCHPADRIMLIETESSTQSRPYNTVSELGPTNHTLSIEGGGVNLDFEFGRRPTSGVYKIWETADMRSDQVRIFAYTPLGGYRMPNGGSIYVQQLDSRRIRVWICHQPLGDGRSFVTTAFSSK